MHGQTDGIPVSQNQLAVNVKYTLKGTDLYDVDVYRPIQTTEKSEH